MQVFLRSALRTALICGGLFGLTSVAPNPAHACSCAAATPEYAEQIYSEAPYVFEGEIISTSRSAFNRPPIIKIKLLKQHKGQFEEEEQNFFYNPNTASCGNALTAGQTMVLAAYNSGETMPRIGNYCLQYIIRQHLTPPPVMPEEPQEQPK